MPPWALATCSTKRGHHQHQQASNCIIYGQPHLWERFGSVFSLNINIQLSMNNACVIFWWILANDKHRGSFENLVGPHRKPQPLFAKQRYLGQESDDIFLTTFVLKSFMQTLPWATKTSKDRQDFSPRKVIILKKDIDELSQSRLEPKTLVLPKLAGWAKSQLLQP